ncbi:MAG: WbqC family protein [Thermomonas sp.]
MIVVISQPMFFPWVGLLEQMHAADTYVRYPDVQFSKTSFVNRVQIKTSRGVEWLTVPRRELHRGQRINEVAIDNRQDWRSKHLDALRRAYAEAPYVGDMLDLARAVYAHGHETIDTLATATEQALCRYFAIGTKSRFLQSETLGIGGSGSRRLLDIVLAIGGSTYLTGHGASRYLDHQLFEDAGIRVEYMDYAMTPYPQLHGAFTPYVSALDLVANLGSAGIDYIRPRTTYWKDFLRER